MINVRFGKVKAEQFCLDSAVERAEYEEILNDPQIRVLIKKDHIDRAGSVVIYLEYVDMNPQDVKKGKS